MKLEHFIQFVLEGKLALNKLLHSSYLNMISFAIWVW